MDTLFKQLSNIDQSSNVLVKNLRDLIEKHPGSFDQDKKLLKNAVTKGTKMVQKIQNISNTLKTSNMPLPTELQSELEEINNRAATELKKLKGLENAKELDEMQKEYKNKYAVVRGKMEELAKLGMALRKGENTKSSGTQAKNNANSEEFKTESIEFITSMTSFLFTAEKDSKKVSDKHKIASHDLSNMRYDLIKVEQMKYHLLLSQK